jgi:DNA-binding IclR family transcriptional regulator
MGSPSLEDLPAPKALRSRGVDRAIDLLECLHAARQPLRVGDLARRLQAPRSTVYELVNRFLAAGILETLDQEGRVFFGRTIHFYGTAYLEAHDFSRRARLEVQQLAEATGETAQYCTLHGNKYTVVHCHNGARLFSISGEIGTPVPIPWTASGRLLLDHMTEAEIADFVPAEDFQLPGGRRLPPAQFYAEVSRARADGFCITRGLIDDFSCCMAAPVRDGAGVAAGCMCLVVPGEPREETLLVSCLLESASRLALHVPVSPRFVKDG